MNTLTQCCGMTNEPPPAVMILKLQERADERDDGCACKRSDDGAVAAEDRSAPDDHRGNGVKLAKLPCDRIEAAKIGDVDDTRPLPRKCRRR